MGKTAALDATVLERSYNPHADAYLVLAKINDRGSPRPYCLYWQSRNPAYADRIMETRRYMDYGTAHRRFTEDMADGRLPSARLFQADWQQEAVYRWEGDFVYSFKQTIDEVQARALIRRVSRDYGIKPPGLTMEAHTDHSWYHFDSNRIHFGHRDHIGLLHELAHAVYEQGREANDHDIDAAAPHCPAFVWTLIELYNRYAGISLSYLSISAANRALTGDIMALQLVENTPSATIAVQSPAAASKLQPSR